MGRQISFKCLTCSRLNAETARRLHGPDGDQCWDDLKCHKRRSHYRHRSERNLKRSLSRQGKGESTKPEIVCLPTRNPYAALLIILYSDSSQHPKQIKSVHAVEAELWVNGEPQVRMEPVHCFDLSRNEFRSLARQILTAFSEHYGSGKPFEAFSEAIYHDMHHCPIRPCPLHS